MSGWTPFGQNSGKVFFTNEEKENPPKGSFLNMFRLKSVAMISGS